MKKEREAKEVVWDGKTKTLKTLMPLENVIKPTHIDRESKTAKFYFADGNIVAKVGDVLKSDEQGNVSVIHKA